MAIDAPSWWQRLGLRPIDDPAMELQPGVEPQNPLWQQAPAPVQQNPLMNYPSSAAQVPPDTMSDVGPVMGGHWLVPYHGMRPQVDVGNEVSSEVAPVRAQENLGIREMERRLFGGDSSVDYAQAIQDAMLARRRAARR